MSENKKWVINNNIYNYADIPGIESKLPFGIYQLEFNSFTGSFFLEKISDKFELPSKIYDTEDGLVDRIKTSFNGFNKNFGVLFKGLKGTGKTVISKQLGNELGLPVICINKNFNDISGFINSIQQDVVILFDEFEKVYELSSYRSDDDEDDEENPNNNKKGVSSLLTLMDGVFTSQYKRLFLLTTNKEYMPDALISRPSRIRYVKDFKDMSLDIIRIIFDDIVENKDLIPGLMSIIKNLDIITIDIIKSVAEEANMYNTADAEFFKIFNLTRKQKSTYLVAYDKLDNEISREYMGRHQTLETFYAGYNFRFSPEEDTKLYRVSTKIKGKDYFIAKEVNEDTGKVTTKELKFKVEEVESLHNMFKDVSAYSVF